MALVLESAKKIWFFYFFIEKTATRYTLFARYILGAHCNVISLTKIKLARQTQSKKLYNTEMKDTI